ncbi:S-methyl-5'-thioadenosine phosphorylase [Psychrobium sp. 1_MG-2023]|uniref:S-methyl-5'-thioadenosine phosphorylase n=1 Tax=Psychrobium sp. 1_MG-2023 TaxID=3062624 RepID=UPI000C32876D|nr:S-methyl-5'-thioadenosine phosphorylase [Psychrobium sp. 1_MG-2023]MDP2560067.1 S-methyl-5'-thioadenosine phosphorylase [Psychrobium sp. 1_MG-2023]PKF56272.1 S-methyl-5'-thioadenosine phosphorylase [Alteromonadales bacterium alter-6D02]
MLAIIGGTGIYQLDGLSITSTHHMTTPFGDPSADIIEGTFNGSNILFLPRHGEHHQLLPHEVNYRANIWSLKQLGATQVIGISATGSLQQEIEPGDLSLPNQYIDFIKSPRDKTFFGHGLAAHISTAQPTCQRLADGIAEVAHQQQQTIHRDKTYVCVDGPRLGTQAESLFFKNAMQADLVGMTNVPEVFLAAEAQLCYTTLAIATDYDSWQDDPALHVTVEQVISRYGSSLERAKEVLKQYLLTHQSEIDCPCRHSLDNAILTPEAARTPQHQELLEVLQR